MLNLSEYSAGSVYYRPNNLTTILHLVSIIVMLLLFLAHDKILLKFRVSDDSPNRILQGDVDVVRSMIFHSLEAIGSCEWSVHIYPFGGIPPKARQPLYLTNRPTDRPTNQPTDQLTD